MLAGSFLLILGLAMLVNFLEVRVGKPAPAMPDEMRVWTGLSVAFTAAFLVTLLVNPSC